MNQPEPRPHTSHDKNGLNIDVTHTHGAQIGDHNIQHNYFGGTALPSASAVVTPILAPKETIPSVFVGRTDEVAKLLDLLNPAPQDGTIVISAIAGLAGIGKTALARQAATAAVGKGWFSGGAIIVDLHGYDPERRIEPSQVFASVLRAIGVDPARIPLDPDQQAAAYHQILSDLAEQGQHVLLVLDNASSPSQVADLIPVSNAHRVLITSRHTFGDLNNASLIELDVLTTSAAVTLIDQLLRQRDPNDHRTGQQPEDAIRLTEQCGALPLALQIVSAVLADERNIFLSDLVIELADTGTRLDGLAYGDRAVRGAFDLSWRHLTDHDQSAARLFRLLSVNPGSDFSLDVASAVADQNPVISKRQLRTLRRAHLIEPDLRANRWRMHDLIYLYSSSLGEEYAQIDDRRSCQERLVRSYAQTAAAAASWIDSHPSNTDLKFFSSKQSALKWLSDERANLVATVRLAHALQEHDTAIDLSCSVCPYLESHRHLADSLSVSEIALQSARVVDLAVREAGVLNNIGVALTSMRRYKEAIRYLNKAVAKARQADDATEEAIALTSLAGALRQRFGPHLGIDELYRAIQLSHKVKDIRSAAFAMTNLGIALREGGSFVKAEQILRSALEIHVEIGSRRAEASTLAQLATTLNQMGKQKASIPLFQQAIDAYRDVGDKNGEGMTLLNFANLLRETGDINGALDLYSAGLQIFRDTNDPHAYALTQANIGLSLRQLGRHTEAEPFLSAAKETLSRLGDERNIPILRLSAFVIARQRLTRSQIPITTSEVLSRTTMRPPCERGPGI